METLVELVANRTDDLIVANDGVRQFILLTRLLFPVEYGPLRSNSNIDGLMYRKNKNPFRQANSAPELFMALGKRISFETEPGPSREETKAKVHPRSESVEGGFIGLFSAAANQARSGIKKHETTRSMSSIKRDVKKKAPPRPEDRDSFSRSSPLSFVTPKMFGLLFHCRKLSLCMVAKIECERRGKQDDVNHGSIRGSWPIAISGYPRGHSV